MENNEYLYYTIDALLSKADIDSLIDKAILMCRVMKEDNKRLYDCNIKRLFPNREPEFYTLGAMLLNDFSFNYI